ncbi:MAG: hypothetical protein R3Y56_07270 [Akkermansia sp.]
MQLYIDTSSSPPALLTSFTSSDSLVNINKIPLSALKMKRGDRLAITVTVLDSTTARSLKFGARAKGDLAAGLLVYAETEEYTISGSNTVFTLIVTVHTDELTNILGIGTEKELASIITLAEFSWVEGDSYRISESVSTTLYNDIIRDGSIEIPESSGVVASTSWVNSKLEEAFYSNEELTQFSGESESNATFTTMMLDARYIPAGKLQSIDMLCRTGTSTGFAPAPAYLHIWQENAEGEFVKIGTSSNMITQVAGTVQAWEFDSLEIQSANTKIMASANVYDGWENFINLGAQSFERADDDSISSLYHSAGTTMNYIPEMNIRVLQEVERYTSQASFNNHAEDSSIHITEEERRAWNDKADSSSIASKVNSSTFTAHSGNDEIHITEEERSAWNGLIEGGGSSNASSKDICDCAYTTEGDPTDRTIFVLSLQEGCINLFTIPNTVVYATRIEPVTTTDSNKEITCELEVSHAIAVAFDDTNVLALRSSYEYYQSATSSDAHTKHRLEIRDYKGKIFIRHLFGYDD